METEGMSSVLNNGFSMTERLLNGGKMILLGMLTVFAVIFIIWLMLVVFKFFVYDLSAKKKSKTEDEAGPAVTEAPDTSDDEETVAVIMAAVSAYRSAESPDGKALPFRVVSFKKKNSNTPWNM